MVFIRNITGLHSEMTENECLTLRFKSGRDSIIQKYDNLTTFNGDLRFERETEIHGRCIVYIDPSEVESVFVTEKTTYDLLREK
ncbi:hypothetical protein [Methanobrevibacter sp.]